MKRDSSGQIILTTTGKTDFITHDIGDQNQTLFQSYWECIYEKVIVRTDAGRPLDCLKFTGTARVKCYDTSSETKTTRTELKDDHLHEQEIMGLFQQNKYNAYCNCYGYALIDGQSWLNLDSVILPIILEEEGYHQVDVLDATDGLVFYFNDENLLHAAKYEADGAIYSHKTGCNTFQKGGTPDISNIYEYNRMALYTK